MDENLFTSVKNLAETAEEQIEYLKSIGTYPMLDELALEYNYYFTLIAHYGNENISKGLMIKMQNLDELLDTISGSAKSELWLVAALEFKEWAEIRNLANNILQDFLSIEKSRFANKDIKERSFFLYPIIDIREWSLLKEEALISLVKNLAATIEEHNIYELALEYNANFTFVKQDENRTISKKLMRKMQNLDELLNAISGTAKSELWESKEWYKIRNLAKDILQDFNIENK